MGLVDLLRGGAGLCLLLRGGLLSLARPHARVVPVEEDLADNNGVQGGAHEKAHEDCTQRRR